MAQSEVALKIDGGKNPGLRGNKTSVTMWPLYSLICSQLLHTLNSQLCWMGNCTSWILSHTGIYPSMPVANISYGKNAAPCTQHCCCQWRLGSYHSTMKMPGDTQWLISFGNRAHYLDITPLIHNIRWKGEWRNFGRLWRKDEMRPLFVINFHPAPLTSMYHLHVIWWRGTHFQHCWKLYMCMCHCDDILHYWSSAHSFLYPTWLLWWKVQMIPHHLSVTNKSLRDHLPSSQSKRAVHFLPHLLSLIQRKMEQAQGVLKLI